MIASTAIVIKKLAAQAGSPLPSNVAINSNKLGSGIASTFSEKFQSLLNNNQITLSPGQQSTLKDEQEGLATDLQTKPGQKNDQNDPARNIVKRAAKMLNTVGDVALQSFPALAETVVAITQKAVDALAHVDPKTLNTSSSLPNNQKALSAFSTSLNATPQPLSQSQPSSPQSQAQLASQVQAEVAEQQLQQQQHQENERKDMNTSQGR